MWTQRPIQSPRTRSRDRVMRLYGVSLLLAIAATSGSIILTFFQPAHTSGDAASQLAVADLQRRITTLEADKARLESQLARRQADSAISRHTPTPMAALEERTRLLDNRVANVERVVLADPVKSLDMVLLKKDFESLRQNNAAEVSSLRQATDRVYDQNKWIIGLMFTMAIGLFSLAVAGLFRDRRSTMTDSSERTA